MEDQPPVPGGTTAIRDGQYVKEERAPGSPIPEKGLPPAWIVFEACAKCGATVPKIKYQSWQCHPFSTDPELKARHDGNHFHAHCWRCGYSWSADMKGKPR